VAPPPQPGGGAPLPDYGVEDEGHEELMGE
jgi:hypothetical protein